jgi:hypothetical protein
MARKLGVFKGILSGEDLLAYQAFSQLCALTAHYEDLESAVVGDRRTHLYKSYRPEKVREATK